MRAVFRFACLYLGFVFALSGCVADKAGQEVIRFRILREGIRPAFLVPYIAGSFRCSFKRPALVGNGCPGIKGQDAFFLFEKAFDFKNQFLHANDIKFGLLDQPLSYLSQQAFEADMPSEYIDILKTL